MEMIKNNEELPKDALTQMLLSRI